MEGQSGDGGKPLRSVMETPLEKAVRRISASGMSAYIGADGETSALAVAQPIACGRQEIDYTAVARIEETRGDGDTGTTSEGVKADVERTIDHLQRHLVTGASLGDLKKAVEQAGRTNSKSDAAVGDVIGRALR